MKTRILVVTIAIALQLSSSYLSMVKAAQVPKDDHAQHHADVNKRGDQAMGFSHEKTTHHFRLKPDGGVIEVSAKDPKDSASRDQIRHHLTRIVELFGKGDFSLPMFTHGEAPPGTAEMTRLKAEIGYSFEAAAWLLQAPARKRSPRFISSCFFKSKTTRPATRLR